MDDVLDRVVSWGRARPDVIALILTSSRARPGAPVDDLSDHDVIVAVDDPVPYATSVAWHEELGMPLVRWGDDDTLEGFPTVFRGVIYADGSKIDFTVWPHELLTHIASLERLPDELDAGYRVLLDDDGATAEWGAPTFRAFVRARPSVEGYRALVEEFWWDVSYAAKALHRGELIFATSFMLDHEMRLDVLTRMLEWRIEVDHVWSLPLGTYGRQLDHHLPSELRDALLATYTGAGSTEGWDALERLCALFRRVAIEVAEALDLSYPAEIDDAMTARMRALRADG
jgi:aminoglycoside 6-adenylyltransferase